MIIKVDDDFIDAMADNFYNGVLQNTGRQHYDWKKLKWDHKWQLLYTSKLIGHLAAANRAESAEDRKMHLAAVACNANILWYHQKE